MTQTNACVNAAVVYDAILSYAVAHPGSTPTQQQLADALGVSQTWVSLLMMDLAERGRIQYTSRYGYCIPGAQFIPPEG